MLAAQNYHFGPGRARSFAEYLAPASRSRISPTPAACATPRSLPAAPGHRLFSDRNRNSREDLTTLAERIFARAAYSNSRPPAAGPAAARSKSCIWDAQRCRSSHPAIELNRGRKRLGALLIDVAAAVKAISAMTAKGRSAATRQDRHDQRAGRDQQKLDVLADDSHQELRMGGLVAGMASEELEEPTRFRRIPARPLSSGVRSPRWILQHDVNVSVGTIFSCCA